MDESRMNWTVAGVGIGTGSSGSDYSASTLNPGQVPCSSHSGSVVLSLSSSSSNTGAQMSQRIGTQGKFGPYPAGLQIQRQKHQRHHNDNPVDFQKQVGEPCTKSSDQNPQTAWACQTLGLSIGGQNYALGGDWPVGLDPGIGPSLNGVAAVAAGLPQNVYPVNSQNKNAHLATGGTVMGGDGVNISNQLGVGNQIVDMLAMRRGYSLDLLQVDGRSLGTPAAHQHPSSLDTAYSNMDIITPTLPPSLFQSTSSHIGIFSFRLPSTRSEPPPIPISIQGFTHEQRQQYLSLGHSESAINAAEMKYVEKKLWETKVQLNRSQQRRLGLGGPPLPTDPMLTVLQGQLGELAPEGAAVSARQQQSKELESANQVDFVVDELEDAANVTDPVAPADRSRLQDYQRRLMETDLLQASRISSARDGHDIGLSKTVLKNGPTDPEASAKTPTSVTRRPRLPRPDSDPVELSLKSQEHPHLTEDDLRKAKRRAKDRIRNAKKKKEKEELLANSNLVEQEGGVGQKPVTNIGQQPKSQLPELPYLHTEALLLRQGQGVVRLNTFSEAMRTASELRSLHHWELFVDQYFSPYGTITYELVENDYAGPSCFDIPRPLIPRFFHTQTISGVCSSFIAVDTPHEAIIFAAGQNPSDPARPKGIVVQSNNATWHTMYENGCMTVSVGYLRVTFSADLANKVIKIERLETVTDVFEEFVARSALFTPEQILDTVSNHSNEVSETTSPSKSNNGRLQRLVFDLESMLPTAPDSTLGQTLSRKDLENLGGGSLIPPSPVEPCGVSMQTKRFLEFTKTMAKMQDLFDLCNRQEIGPRDALLILAQCQTALENGTQIGGSAGMSTPGKDGSFTTLDPRTQLHIPRSVSSKGTNYDPVTTPPSPSEGISSSDMIDTGVINGTPLSYTGSTEPFHGARSCQSTQGDEFWMNSALIPLTDFSPTPPSRNGLALKVPPLTLKAATTSTASSRRMGLKRKDNSRLEESGGSVTNGNEQSSPTEGVSARKKANQGAKKG